MYLPRIFQIASESPEALVKICFRQISKPLSRHRTQSLSMRFPPLSRPLKCQQGRFSSQCCSDGCHVDGPQDKEHLDLGAQHKQWPGTHLLLRPTMAHASSVLIKVIPFSVVFSVCFSNAQRNTRPYSTAGRVEQERKSKRLGLEETGLEAWHGHSQRGEFSHRLIFEDLSVLFCKMGRGRCQTGWPLGSLQFLMCCSMSL